MAPASEPAVRERPVIIVQINNACGAERVGRAWTQSQVQPQVRALGQRPIFKERSLPLVLMFERIQVGSPCRNGRRLDCRRNI